MRQGIPDAGEAEIGEVRFVARGKFGHAMMAQGQGQARVKDRAARPNSIDAQVRIADSVYGGARQ